MSISPGDGRNLAGCLIIATVLALFVVTYLLVGLNARPENSVATQIQISPTNQH